MIEIGIHNILGTYRTDTPYDPQYPNKDAKGKCQSNLQPPQPCIQVRLQLAMFWNRNENVGPVPTLQQRKFGNDTLGGGAGPFGGYVINDGSSYAPQMPWFMSHYCEAGFTGGDGLDPVCYADYLSTFNDGFNLVPKTPSQPVPDWPGSLVWSVSPNDNDTRNHCQPGLTTCTLVMAGFDLSPVPNILSNLQYYTYSPPQPAEPDGGPNNRLFKWFNNALNTFPDNYTKDDFYRHFPWSGTPVTWGTTPLSGGVDLYNQARSNPFLGTFTFTTTGTGGDANCKISLTEANPNGCNTVFARADHYLYPRQCNLTDLATTDPNVARLRACSLNYELHHNGWYEEWPASIQPDLDQTKADMLGNQYGRTSFLFAGVPGMQLPVSYYSSANSPSVYEQVHNASIFSVYLPIANEADFKNGLIARKYIVPEFYHTLLMSNHMESDPDEFAEGIRGKVLWHNEYRSENMYKWFVNEKNTNGTFPAKMFKAAFKFDPTNPNADMPPAPFHNNTCDGCHVRNGSGVPIKPAPTLASTAFTLDTWLQPAKGGVHDRSDVRRGGANCSFARCQGLYVHGANTAHEASVF